VQLDRAPQVPEPGPGGGQVGHDRAGGGRVGPDGDGGRPLQVVDPGAVAAVEPAGPDPLEGLGPEAVQVEGVSDGERRPAGLDGLGALPADDVGAGQLGQDEPLGLGGGRIVEQGRRLAQVPHALLAVALAAQQAAEQGPGLGRPLPVAGSTQGVGGLGEQLGPGQLGVHAGLAEAEQPPRAGRVAGLGQLQGAGVEAGRGVEGVQGGGPVAGLPERDPGPPGQHGRVLLTGRPGELQRPRVVVGEQLGPVLGPVRGERGDPLGGPAVLVGPGGPGDLAVGDVAEQDVPEAVLGLPRHRRAALRGQEVARLQDLEVAPDGLGGPAGQGAQRAQPDHRPGRARGHPASPGRSACGRTPRRTAGCRRPAPAAAPGARPGARWSRAGRPAAGRCRPR
jgi:hypothetical protein